MSNSPNILLSHNIRNMCRIQVPQVLRLPRCWVLFSSVFAEAGWQQGSFPTTVLRRLLLSATDWHATAVFLWRNWFYYFHWTEPWLNSALSLHSSQRYSWFTPLGGYDSSTENFAVINFIIINTYETCVWHNKLKTSLETGCTYSELSLTTSFENVSHNFWCWLTQLRRCLQSLNNKWHFQERAWILIDLKPWNILPDKNSLFLPGTGGLFVVFCTIFWIPKAENFIWVR